MRETTLHLIIIIINYIAFKYTKILIILDIPLYIYIFKKQRKTLRRILFKHIIFYIRFFVIK